MCSDGEEELNNVFFPFPLEFLSVGKFRLFQELWVRGNPPETQFFTGTEDGNHLGIRDRRLAAV